MTVQPNFCSKKNAQKLGCAVASLKIKMSIFCVLSNCTVIFGLGILPYVTYLDIYLIFNEAYASVILLKEAILKQMNLGSQMN